MIGKWLQFPTAWVAKTRKSTFDTDITGHGSSINSAVKALDYPELKSSLRDLLGQYRSVLVFPGEPSSVIERAVHHIRLNPETKTVYIPVYRLPHSQRTIVDSMINDTVEQGRIRESRSPWNSPLFFVPKKRRNIQTGH